MSDDQDTAQAEDAPCRVILYSSFHLDGQLFTSTLQVEEALAHGWVDSPDAVPSVAEDDLGDDED